MPNFPFGFGASGAGAGGSSFSIAFRAANEEKNIPSKDGEKDEAVVPIQGVPPCAEADEKGGREEQDGQVEHEGIPLHGQRMEHGGEA